jgi:BirA family biotin operon repressor/biotin-[acetyl-CoA-carboxylase] ligase
MNKNLTGLVAKTIGKPAYYLESVDSTNCWLKDKGGILPHGAVCWTGCQTAGRGRLGRSWHSKSGQSLAMSILIKPSGENSALLPLICGIAVSRALNGLTGKEFFIKWPNDIICQERKICGILCENNLSLDGSFAVAGIGINLTQSADYFEQAELPHAGSLKMFCSDIPDMATIAAEVINCIEPLWLTLSKKGFGSIKHQYQSLCINLGREVYVLSSDGKLIRRGKAVGIADNGSLLVDSGSGPIPVNAGEVSVRSKDGYI